MSKLKYSDIALELRETSKLSMEVKGSYSYATGAYESIIADIVADLPEHKQREVVRNLESVRNALKESA